MSTDSRFTRGKGIASFFGLITLSLFMIGCGPSRPSDTPLVGSDSSSSSTAPSRVIEATSTPSGTGPIASDTPRSELRARAARELSAFASPTRPAFYSTDRRPLTARRSGDACLDGFWFQGTEEIEKQYRASVREDFPLNLVQGAFTYIFFPRENAYQQYYEDVTTELKLPIMGASTAPSFIIDQKGGLEGTLVRSTSDRYEFKDMDTTNVKMNVRRIPEGGPMLSEASFGMINGLEVPFRVVCDDRRMDLTYTAPSGEVTIRLQR